ncbi:MAG: adenosylcobalamin-dependent ribonucleoside-diphosphate reductase, partial [Anaerolineae bacterium]|nr:adenosylcobalamin-dependent ribonucleoside-diphosphate reductase [Anaerolineae bacterium]
MKQAVTADAADVMTMPEAVREQSTKISPNGLEVLRRRYLRKGPDGKPIEDVPQMFWRVASNVALPERSWSGDEAYVQASHRFYDLLANLKFFPNSPTFTGAGTPLGQLAACFVLAIADDMGKDSPEGIFNTLRNAALIQQTGGGNGFSFSRLRPKGGAVNTSAGVASGPVGFLRVYDAAFGEIAQGGTRRGANMGVLRVDHPDIEEFIACKSEEGQISNFNISVGVTDVFMQAVKEDGDFDLIDPRSKQPVRSVRARDLFDSIIKHAHLNGEPGVLFLDAANRSNPVPHLYELEATNPCGEQFLGPYENCCLGSINVSQHVTADGCIDWDALEETVVTATRFLDDVVSANKYVPAVPQLEDAAHRVRRIGLGIMGLADVMYMMGVRYGDRESMDLAGQVMEFVRYHCMRTSIELARERGPFPAISGSLYDPDDLHWQPPTPVQPYTHDFDRPSLSWDLIVDGIKAHGIRNGAQTTIAPTGTIGTVTGCEGYGCEPVFALAYTRYVKEAAGDVALTYVSPLFLRALDAAGIVDDERQAIVDQIVQTGTCQGIDELPADLQHTFVVSQDITPTEHVMMQAVLQRFVDNSISKCVIGDTLVLTAQGLTPISELSEMRLPDQFEALQTDIVSPEGCEPTDAFYYGGHRETRKIGLAYGFQIEGTPNHRIHVLDNDGSIQFRQLEDLRLGDVAVLYSGQRNFGLAGQSLPGYQGEYRTNSKPVTFPRQLNPDLSFLLGAITAEGAITRNGVVITNSDTRLLDDLRTIFAEQFDLSSTLIDDPRSSAYSLQINSRPLRNWLLTDLGLEAGAENKIIPGCILRASLEEIAAFLRGLLLDGFMTADGKLFGITLASERLVRQLQMLLLNAGVLATARQTAERAWNLTVQGGELETLSDLISFVEFWKNERIARRNEDRVQRFRNYSRLLPVTVTNALRTMQATSRQSLRSLYSDNTDEASKAYQRARVNLLQSHRLERGDAYEIYAHFEQDSSDVYADSFFRHDEDGKVYVAVQSISVGFAEVFDISVPGSHSFVANGLGNHNTCNFPPEATADDVAKAYMMAWELDCKGLTVYVTGSREEVVLETKATAEAKKGASDSQPANGTAGHAETLVALPHQPEGTLTNGNGNGKEHAELVSYDVKRPRPRKLHGSTYR